MIYYCFTIFLNGYLGLADIGLATASIVIARKRDPKFAAHYLPMFAWTCFAPSLAIYQALENDDPFLGA